MDQKEISFTYHIYSGKNALSQKDQDLLKEAYHATSLAYAPYSNFKVGVAIRTFDDQVITGSNQENGSFPVGQCAERVALYRLNHELGRKSIDTIAIISDHEMQQSPASPCGSCRQM